MRDFENTLDGVACAVVECGDEERVAINGSAVAEGMSSGKVLIVPWGQVCSSNGDFVLDEEASRLVVEAFVAHGTDLPIDYEHQSLGGKYSSPSGQAPAAGWIRALRLVWPGEVGDVGCVGSDAETRGRGDAERVEPMGAVAGIPGELEPGLYAEVEWTVGAQAKLAAREYRYLSPVVIVRKRDRRVVSLHSAALTNKPAIVGMRPIVNSEGLAVEWCEGEEDAKVGECEGEKGVKGVKGVKGAKVGECESDGVEVLRFRLGLDEQADVEAVVMAADRRLAELEGAEQRLAELEGDVRGRDAEDRVLAAVRAGKLVAGQREWAMSLAMREPEVFDEWAATAPVVVALGRTEAPGDGGVDRKRSVVVASARAAYRADSSLSLLTSEAAWVGQALRDAGVES